MHTMYLTLQEIRFNGAKLYFVADLKATRANKRDANQLTYSIKSKLKLVIQRIHT